jgi:hypothetical protein
VHPAQHLQCLRSHTASFETACAHHLSSCRPAVPPPSCGVVPTRASDPPRLGRAVSLSAIPLLCISRRASALNLCRRHTALPSRPCCRPPRSGRVEKRPVASEGTSACRPAHAGRREARTQSPQTKQQLQVTGPRSVEMKMRELYLEELKGCLEREAFRYVVSTGLSKLSPLGQWRCEIEFS